MNRISIANISPGPWSTVSSGTEAHWEHVGIESIDGTLVAHVKGIGSNKERTSNASLIAASPALLDAALGLLEFWDNGTPVHPGADVVTALRAAISLANN